MIKLRILLPILALFSVEAYGDSSTLDAAIGGGIGGATGAVIGNEVGGRDGAIVGGAIGAAVGTAIATDDAHERSSKSNAYREYTPAGGGHPKQYHCPPGQRKKGRC